MNVHKNARLMRHGRERIVRQIESGQTPEAVAQAAGVCPRQFANGSIDTGAKPWPGLATGHPGRIDFASLRLKQLSR